MEPVVVEDRSAYRVMVDRAPVSRVPTRKRSRVRRLFPAEHARTRVLAHIGKPFSHLQGIRFLVAEMQMAVHAARLVLEQAARVADERPAAAMPEMVKSKCVSNTTDVDVCSKPPGLWRAGVP